MSDFKVVLWQAGIAALVILVWVAISALPFVTSRMPEKWFPLTVCVGILVLWVVCGAIISVWSHHWWICLASSIGLGLGLLVWVIGTLTVFHSKLMSSPGQAPMALMMPILIGALVYPVGGLARFVWWMLGRP